MLATDPAGAVEAVTPDPPPLGRRPALRQTWAELAYFHWPYEPAVVQRLLPPGVTVDCFDGAAWVGLIPFEMRRVRTRPLPALPWLGDFIEVNVRTYVVDPVGRRAVWFFSLDVPRSAVVAVARTVFSLPYCWAPARHHRSGPHHRYQLTRRWPRGGPGADIGFRVGEPIGAAAESALDHFLTARWALLTSRRGHLRRGAVEHPRWPLHRVDDVRLDQNLVEAAGLPAPQGRPHARYSPGVDVDIAWFETLPAQTGFGP